MNSFTPCCSHMLCPQSVPDYVPYPQGLERLHIPGDILSHTMKLHWEFKLKCKSEHIQPLPALCSGCCNYRVLMRVIIDCWSQQMKINSLCIMTSLTCSSHLCFERSLLPVPALHLILPSTWTSSHRTQSISLHISEDSAALKANTTSEISLKCSHFLIRPEG